MVARWQENWRVVVAPDTLPVRVPFRRGERAAAEARVRDFPKGTQVVLLADSVGSLGRCRRFAGSAGIGLEREYLAFPSMRSPGYLVENAPRPTSYFLSALATVPPAPAAVSGLAELALRFGTKVLPSTVLARLSPGCVAVGRRT